MNRLGFMAVTVGTVDFKNHNFPNLFIYTNSLTDRSSGHKTDWIVNEILHAYSYILYEGQVRITVRSQYIYSSYGSFEVSSLFEG